MSTRDSNLQSHHSLPARPPPSTHSAPPSRPANTAAPGVFAGFTPRSVTAHAPPQVSSYSSASVSAPYQSTQYAAGTNPHHNVYQAYAGNTAATFQGLPENYNAEEEAQIAEWNSAYSRDDGNQRKNGTSNYAARSDLTSTKDNDTSTTADGKRKTVVRQGGGKTWEDTSLLEWDPMHPRLFVGNLAGEVTDDSLFKAFSKYPSLVKARVVRDKRSTKSKSYGFVSFSDTDDYFRAAKEMNNKYIGSHPVLVKRANTDIKAVTKKEDKRQNTAKNNKNKAAAGNRPNPGSGVGGAGVVASAPPMMNPVAFQPRSVQKKGKASGPRVLG